MSGALPRRRRAAGFGYVVATLLAFPHELPWGGSIDFGPVFVWLVPALLVLAVDGLAPRAAARAAFLWSLLAHALFFHWFSIVTLVYGGMPFWLGVFAPLVPALWVSGFTALFAWGWARFMRGGGVGNGAASVVFGAALWVAVDWLRGHLFGGFPWATLGYALHADWPLLVFTRWTGVYGLSFLAVATGIALVRTWPGLALEAGEGRGEGGRSGRVLAALVGLVALLHVAGPLVARWTAPAPEVLRTVRVAAVQGNIDQADKWSADRRARIVATYLRLSEAAAAESVDWIVWPETAVPGLIEFDAGLREALGALARRHGVSLVIGGMGAEADHAARRYSAFYDSAFVFDRGGVVRDRYDKTHLVPFGEFVPLRALLGHFFQSLARGLSSSDVTPGARPRPVRLAVDDAGAETRVLVGVPICYELLFPHLVRHFAREGAGALLAITNDAWYGRTGAPHQFLAMTVLRAAENARPTVRAANTGISAIIDRNGRVIRESPLFEEALVVGEIALPTAAERAGGSGGTGRVSAAGAAPTFYARFGDVFAGLCIALVVGGAVGRALRRRRDERRGEDNRTGEADEG